MEKAEVLCLRDESLFGLLHDLLTQLLSLAGVLLCEQCFSASISQWCCPLWELKPFPCSQMVLRCFKQEWWCHNGLYLVKKWGFSLRQSAKKNGCRLCNIETSFRNVTCSIFSVKEVFFQLSCKMKTTLSQSAETWLKQSHWDNETFYISFPNKTFYSQSLVAISGSVA